MTLKVTPEDLERYCATLRSAALDAPWSRPGPLIEPKKTQVQPCLWRWAEIEPLVRRSAEFVSPDRGAERRILRLANPGVPERTSTHTISVAVQYLLPGEVAPAHRHTPNALRFMIHGRGAYTTVEGDKCAMSPGDLVLTPTQAWHDHGNEGTEPVIWADGLDSPVVRYLEILAMQPHAEDRQPIGKISGISERRFGTAGLRGCAGTPEGPQRLIHYRWESTYNALLALADLGLSPFDDVMMEYVDPSTGRPVLPTIGCYIQMIRPGIRTRPHRHNSCAVYHVVRGSGSTTVDGTRYQWQPRDFFSVPPWAQHEHVNHGPEPAILFSMQDTPLLTALGLYREEESTVTKA
jgi:gentisate 1,2-dioxygenase